MYSFFLLLNINMMWEWKDGGRWWSSWTLTKEDLKKYIMYSKYHCNAKLHNIGQDKIGQVYADLRQKSMVKKNLPLNFYIRLYILIGNKPKPDSCCSHFTKNGVTSMWQRGETNIKLCWIWAALLPLPISMTIWSTPKIFGMVLVKILKLIFWGQKFLPTPRNPSLVRIFCLWHQKWP